MEAKELRIGNLIEYNGSIETVYNIKNSGVDFFRGTTKKGVITQGYIWKAISPIPITFDLLVKLGFEWSIQHQSYKKIGFKYVVDFYENHPQTNCNLAFLKENHRNGETLISVKYVHQLQNLYFALTQTELTIN